MAERLNARLFRQQHNASSAGRRNRNALYAEAGLFKTSAGKNDAQVSI
ncbi:hypothetical protein [Marinicella sp. W31]